MSEPPREATPHALDALERLWHRKRGDRQLPERRDFAVEEFRPWFGHLRIIRVAPEPPRLKVTLDGTEIVAMAGVDLTGRHLDVVYDTDDLRYLLDFYIACIDGRAPLRETLAPDASLVNFGEMFRMALPCGRDGVVDHLIYSEYAFNLTVWSRSVFADLGRLKL